MPQFCANLTMLFTEYPFLERFAAAKAAGFDAVEILFPYDVAAPEIIRELKRNDLTLALINCPPPNYVDEPRGFAAVAGSRFRTDFKRALRVAKALGAHHLHLMAGVADGQDALSVFRDNLAWAAGQAPEQSLTIEPINRDDMPGYFLADFDVAADIIRDVNAPNLRLQFDAYHAQKIEGDAVAVWQKHKDIVAHVQVGQTPHRHEPDAGEIDYPAFFDMLDQDGFTGWVSGEYHPAGRTEEGLGWIVG